MASIFSTVHTISAVVSQGSEQKNAYDTGRDSIDTARGDSTEQELFNSILGPSGFKKGYVWATSQGPVQIALDEEIHKKDGSAAESSLRRSRDTETVSPVPSFLLAGPARHQ